MAVPPRARADEQARDPRAAELVPRLEPTITAHGLVLEEIELAASGPTTVLRVTVDYAEGTETVDLDTVAGISEALSAVLDSEDLMAEVENYELEVTTPGATRPLVEPRHYRRNIGRLLEISRTGEADIVARLEEVGEDGIRVAEQKPAPKKGMPVKYLDPVDIAFSAITRARVQVEFSQT